MSKILKAFILIVGVVSLLVTSIHAQSPDTTTLKVGILLVQFADQKTNLDARGSVGFSAPAGADTIEQKYRYEDYWNIVFQDSGRVVHPDADFPDNYAIGGRGFHQLGSLKQYLLDNSFGMKHIVPYRVWSGSSGLLNTISPDSTGIPGRSYVNWLTLDTTKWRNLNDTTLIPSFDYPSGLGTYAIETAIDSLAVAWDSLDVLLILYAGVNHFNVSEYGTYKDSLVSLSFAITSERAANDATGIPTFLYPRVIWHEFLHAAISATDLHYRDPTILSTNRVTGVGHYSIMGDNAPLGAYTPEMLDPWHRLRRGWLRYYVPDALLDTLNLSPPLDTPNFHLPIVEERYNGELPYVLVIPVKMHPDTDGWERAGQHYIIVENRRAVGWDSVIVREELSRNSQTYRLPTGTGGFLVWGFVQTNTLRGFIYDADGVWETWSGTGIYGEPEDLFGNTTETQTFSIWSSPNVFSWPKPPYGMGVIRPSRNILLEFPPYIDTSNVNPISRLVIDQFVPKECSYGTNPESDSIPTKFGAQQKMVRADNQYLASFRTMDKTYVMQGSTPYAMRDVAPLDTLISGTKEGIESSAVTYFEGGDSFLATYVWEQKEADTYSVRTHRAVNTFTGSSGCGNYAWGPYSEAPHPVIASNGAFGAIAYRGEDGIYASTTTDRGCDWSAPSRLNGSAQVCHSPFVLIDTSSSGDAFLALFVDQANKIRMYRSGADTAIVISGSTQLECLNPNASRIGNALTVVHQFRDEAADRQYISRKKFDLSVGTVPKDDDAFGYHDQDEYDVNRDPAVLYTDISDTGKSIIYWVFNQGETMLFASNDVRGDGWYQGVESSLRGRPTAYPHLLYHEAGNPICIVSRQGSWRGASASDDNSPSLVVISREQDLNANPEIGQLFTEIGMEFTGGPDRLMHTHMTTPAIVHALDTVGSIQYDYWASEGFSTEPIDTLTRTQTGSLAEDDVVLCTLELACFKAASDTLVIESVLYDPNGMRQVSTSGELRIAPFIGDTTLTVGLEVPKGFPPTDCFISTSMTRGYFAGSASPEIALRRYMLYGSITVPKARSHGNPGTSRDATLAVHPQPARDELRFDFEGMEGGTATLFDLLGRISAEAQLGSNGGMVRGMMDLG